MKAFQALCSLLKCPEQMELGDGDSIQAEWQNPIIEPPLSPGSKLRPVRKTQTLRVGCAHLLLIVGLNTVFRIEFH